MANTYATVAKKWNHVADCEKAYCINELRVLAVPHLGELYPGICFTTEEKARRNLSQGSRRVLVHILPKSTRYKTHTYTSAHYKTHTYAWKVRHTSIRDRPIMNSKRRMTECFRTLHSQGQARLGSRVSQLYRYSTWNLIEDHTILWPISPQPFNFGYRCFVLYRYSLT